MEDIHFSTKLEENEQYKEKARVQTTKPESIQPISCQSPGHSPFEGIGNYDVLCGRSKAVFDSIGNRRFRVTISMALERYQAAKSRKDRSALIVSITALVNSIGGRFLQRKDGRWVELTQKEAHEKTGHALRDMAAALKKSRVAGHGVPSLKSSSSVISKAVKPEVAMKPATEFGSSIEPLPFDDASCRPPRNGPGLFLAGASETTTWTCHSLDDAIRHKPAGFRLSATSMNISQEDHRDLCRVFDDDTDDDESTDKNKDHMLSWMKGESDRMIQYED